MAHGKLGAAQVLISRHRMPDMHYNPKTNTYSAFICNGSRVDVDIGSKIRCRCLEWIVEGTTLVILDKAMKIICEIDQSVLDSCVMGKF
jgi:DNA-directed RNA polymerase subunit E'/Rpb7